MASQKVVRNEDHLLNGVSEGGAVTQDPGLANQALVSRHEGRVMPPYVDGGWMERHDHGFHTKSVETGVNDVNDARKTRSVRH